MSSQTRTQQTNKRGSSSARGRGGNSGRGRGGYGGRGRGGYGGRGRGGRRNRRFKKPKKSPPKKIDWKTYVAPGSEKYFTACANEKIEKDNEKMIRMKRWEAESQGVDKKYLPRTSLTINPNNKNVLDSVEMLGWEYDKESNKFYNNQYNNTPFEAFTILTSDINGDLESKIPIDTDNKDEHGISFIQEVSNAGTTKSFKQNEWTVFWNTRRGKRYSKYIQYRKKRNDRKNNPLMRSDYTDFSTPKTSSAWKENDAQMFM
jgi:hypothetical protein